VTSIVAIGFFTGFYLVPLFTLLQHRAPKTGKGDAIAISNFINVTGAIVASLLFFFIVAAAQKTGFVPRLEPTDRFAVGGLTKLEAVRGRPFYAEVRQADGSTVALGHAPTDADRDDPFGAAPGYAIDLTRGVAPPVGGEPGSDVVVSYYDVRGVRLFTVRAAGELLKPAYDYEKLPELLFLGAGLLTFATLMVLRREMPDLYVRARYFLGRLAHDRLQVVGQQHLPTAGPVVLATDARDPTQQRSLVLATDRYTWFLPGADGVEDAARVLRRDHLVALALDGQPDAETEQTLRRLVERVPELTVVPVTSGAARVAFGPAVKPEVGAAELRAAVERAAEQEEDERH
jgi:hypothetical protein